MVVKASPIPAVAYYRMSSDKQDKSIEEQRSEVRGYAEEHGYKIVREYVDESISGDATEKRVHFQRMMRDATTRRDFEVILCWNQDRFGRFDIIEAGWWIKPVRDAGVRLETIAQGKVDWTENNGQLIYNVNQMGKNEFLKDMARNTTRGRLYAAQEGRIGGPPPFGYKAEHELRKDKKTGKDKMFFVGLKVDDAAAAVVRRIFKRYAALATSIRSIAEELNKAGVPTPTAKSKAWTVVAVARTLNNPVYTGDTVWARRRTGKYIAVQDREVQAQRPGTPYRMNPQDQWVVVKGTHDPLVDRDTWAKVQAKLKANRTATTPFRGGGDFLLSGVVICGHCGRRMVGSRIRATNAKGRVYTYRKYLCPTHTLGGSTRCGYHHVPEEALLAVIVDKVVERFASAEAIAELRAEIERQDRQDDAAADQGQAGVKAAIAKLDKQIQKGNSNLALCPADLVAGVAEQVRAWREERDRLALSLKQTKPRKPAAEMRAEVDRAIAQLKELRRHVEEGDPALVRALVREMVDRVELWWQGEQKAKRVQHTVVRGLIHARPDERLKDLFSAPWNEKQVLTIPFSREDLQKVHRDARKTA